MTVAASVLGIANNSIAAVADPADAVKTTSPIKHVIILVGENRGFDHTFATYRRQARARPSAICCRRASSTPTAARARIMR